MNELRRTLCLGSGHPTLAGHFPGNPVIPGAVLLDEVLQSIERAHAGGPRLTGWQIDSVKFLRAARPEEPMQLCIRAEPPGAPGDAQPPSYGFEITAHGEAVARGRLHAQCAADASPSAANEPSVPPAPVASDQGWRDRPERGSAWLLRWAATLSLRLGRPIGRALLYPGAAYFLCFAPRANAAMTGYLRRVLDRAPRARDRLRLILNFASTIQDRLWLLRQREELFALSMEGEPVVREAVESGGALLMGAHMGSFEVLRLIGRRQGFRVAISMYEAQAQRLNALLSALAPSEQLEIIPVGRVDSMLRMRAALESGALVGVLADRLFAAEPSLPVQFLGGTARFPINPMRLAAVLRQRVIFMLGLYRGKNRYHVIFEPLADFRQIGPERRRAAVEDAIRRYAQLLERRCHSDPYNWFNFFDFWPSAQPPQAAGGAATAGRP
ncbi:MAG TPA: hypothetical protein VKT19_00810 [Steroidobacteraceae bacterium]|nr:hypothetical protein [Steroidobacteraceae bacterium]